MFVIVYFVINFEVECECIVFFWGWKWLVDMCDDSEFRVDLFFVGVGVSVNVGVGDLGLWGMEVLVEFVRRIVVVEEE